MTSNPTCIKAFFFPFLKTSSSNGIVNCNNNDNRGRSENPRRFRDFRRRRVSLRAGSIARPGREANRIRGERSHQTQHLVRSLPVKERQA